ncbi:MAG: hypothetical protein WC058_02090 [Phycisphaeraceae bacterium]
MIQKSLMCVLIVWELAVGAPAPAPGSEPAPGSGEPAGAAVVNIAAELTLPEGFDPGRHMLVGEVEPGMIGYGMTVFHGTTPEPFDVEVISVEQASSPGKAVIWVRSPDPRMQQSGPVHGMSGSPIYLWPRGSKRSKMRVGGDARIIGAFAFGFEFGKDCYVGVQPIEQMLRAAMRTEEPGSDERPPEAMSEEESGASSPKIRNPQSAIRNSPHDNALSLTLAAAERDNWPGSATWRMKAIARMAGIGPASSSLATGRTARWRGTHDAMSLPLQMGDETVASVMRPLLMNTGLTAVAGGSEQAMNGPPPRWIDPAVQPEPGGVLSIPLACGDADMAASGTITDIITVGGRQKILAFGHAFSGQGIENLPIATGYVHFVQPSVQSSFKLGGTLRIFGSLVNDENVGVFGVSGATPPMHPADVTVEWPDASKNRTYHFQLAQHTTYTPMLSGATIIRALTSDTNWPDHSTLAVTSDIDFGGGRVLHIDQLLPEADPRGVMSMLVPAISVLTDSEFGKTPLQSVKTTIKVIPKVLASQIVNVVIQQTSVRPGESVNIDVELRPFQGESYPHRISFPIPADLPEGNYVLFVGGADAYLEQQLKTHPHLGRVTNQKELFGMVQYVMGMKGDAMYASLIPQDRPDVAVGRSELDKLPSSRTAMLLQPTHSLTTPFVATIDRVIPMTRVVVGDFAFPVIVEKQIGNVQPKQ